MKGLITLGIITLVTGLAHGDDDWVVCTECAGSGFIELEASCHLCQGEGGYWEICSLCDGTEYIDVSCHLCGGDGTTDCSWCGGDGWLSASAGNCSTEMEQLCQSCRFGQIACSACEETGVIRKDPCTICVDGEAWIECTGCGGTGTLAVTEICVTCQGQGGSWQEE